MPVETDRRVPVASRARRGLAAVGAVAIVGLLLLLVAQARGAAAWPFGAYLLLACAALGAHYRLVYRRQRLLERRSAAARTDAASADHALATLLERLRAGDLVHAAHHGSRLPSALAVSYARASGSLQGLAEQIQAGSAEVAAASKSVNQIAAELASGSSEQAASVVEITAAMEELARTAAQIAGSAVAQAKLAQRARETAESGAGAVAEALRGVEEVRTRIRAIAARTEVLGARSQEIFAMLDLITDIAQETHILSLSAAVEAAAAGEHERDFSVVAEEVRRLAQRSQESVATVRRLLEEFASSIRATVIATEEGSAEATLVLERARAAATAIEELRSAAADTAEAAGEISVATQEQNAASGEVVLTLREASQVVQRMAEGLKHFSETSNGLSQLALAIQLQAQTFHLDSPYSLKQVAERWGEEARQRLGNWEGLERRLQHLVEERDYVECLYLMDGEAGRAALVVNRKLLGDREVPAAVKAGVGFTERPWYRAATAERRTILTPVFTSVLSGEAIVTAATPLYEEGRLLGVLGFNVNVDSWTKH